VDLGVKILKGYSLFFSLINLLAFVEFADDAIVKKIQFLSALFFFNNLLQVDTTSILAKA
jgi:hypothetical protein